MLIKDVVSVSLPTPMINGSEFIAIFTIDIGPVLTFLQKPVTHATQ